MSKEKAWWFRDEEKGITPLVSPAYGTATLGHAGNVYIRNVLWINIFLLLTLTAISSPSNFQEWKAVRISNYAETFPLCITAQSRISAHYTNSSDVLVRAPLKHKVPLLPARFPQQKSRGRGRWRDGGCNAGMPSQATHSPPALPPWGFLASQPTWGQSLLGWQSISRCLGAPGTQHPVLSAQGQASQRSSYPSIAESCSVTPEGSQSASRAGVGLHWFPKTRQRLPRENTCPRK